MTEYLRARRHSLTCCLKETAASRRWAIAWSCSCVDSGDSVGPSCCAGSFSCTACSSLAGSLLVDLMTTSSVGLGVAISPGDLTKEHACRRRKRSLQRFSIDLGCTGLDRRR